MLKILKVCFSKKLVHIEINNKNLPMLEALAISGCRGLSSVAGLCSLESLKLLNIKDCPNMQFPLQPLPQQLRQCIISNCPQLHEWAEWQQSLIDGEDKLQEFDKESYDQETLDALSDDTDDDFEIFNEDEDDNFYDEMLDMAGLLASGIIKWTANKLSSLLSPPIGSSSTDEQSASFRDLRELQRTLARTQRSLNALDERNIRGEAERLRLWELQQFAYDAQDAVDEYRYQLLRRRIDDQNNQGQSRRSRKRKLKGDKKEPEPPPIKIPVPDDLAARVRELLKKFNEITKEWDDLRLSEFDAPIREEDYDIKISTTSHIGDFNIVGREEDKENIVRILLSPGAAQRHMSVLPVVGMGGLGKTTLAQMVYNNERVSKYFKLKGWVDVSEDHFDIKAIARKILMSFTGKTCDIEDVENLQNMIMAQVEDVKFFLVLDNVWNVEKKNWEALLSFMECARLGMILVTTRNEAVSKMIGTMKSYDLNLLPFEESWQLFKQIAFVFIDQNMHEQFEGFGRKIVGKCGGLPLAIKAIGSSLRGETNEETWKDVSDSDQWELPPTEKDPVLPALKLSYDRMPAQLKRCFVLLSLLPKGYYFWKEDMMNFWMCLGLLKQYSSCRHENIGRLYFDDLIQRAMVQRAESDEKLECFVTHDLIHDLAIFVSQGDLLRINTQYFQEAPKKFRYLSVVVNSSDHRNVDLNSLTIPRGVRILKFVNAQDNQRCSSKLFSSSINIYIPADTWPNLIQLRALDFSHTAVTQLPNSIGDLKLLRYLSLFQARITTIPESISDLHYLRVLDARTDSLREIPQGIKKLVNLQHLNLDLWSPLCMPCGIGALRKLQTLPRFSIGGGSWHSNVAELHHLVNIHGELCITGLRKIRNVDDAQTANLVSKKHLQILRLDWSDGVCINNCSHSSSQNDVATPELEEEIFESLRPNKNIEELEVVNYNGYKYPSWFGASSFMNLGKIILCQQSCKFLPPLGELPQLRMLSIIYMTAVEHVRQEFRGSVTTKAFPALEELEFEEILKWIEWSHVFQDDFPSIRLLKIKDSNELRYLPERLSSSLTKFVIKDCSKLASLPAIPNLTTLVLKSKINEQLLNDLHFPHLRSLKLLLSRSIEHILLDNQNHPLLEVLVISVCPRLHSIMGLSTLGSLKILKINRCPYLQLSFDKPLPPQLRRLTITKCPLLADWLEIQSSRHQYQLHEPEDGWCEEQQALAELNDASEDEQREEFGLLSEDENGEDNDEQDHEQSEDEELQYGSDGSTDEDE
uniref:NB-ARC domain-containing protein n=1 Tax=Leersia perrieri TaxID=77586 RepID=A0A0D9VVV8_9ORYZ